MRKSSYRVVSPLLLAAVFGFGCGGEQMSSPVDGLRSAFPQRADKVLSSPRAWQRVADGYQLESAPSGPWQHGKMKAVVARRAEDGFVIQLDEQFQLRVQEVGARGLVEAAEEAISYATEGGRAYWVATAGGVEEWLLVQRDVTDEGVPVASWQVEGGHLTQWGDSVAIAASAAEPAKVIVSAPLAYGPRGNPISVRLAVKGQRIDVHVEASEGPLLIDPIWLDDATMMSARAWHAAARLGNGQVVALGGSNAGGIHGAVEIYDPVAKSWAALGTQGIRERHTATSLNDGTVLFAGGTNGVFDVATTQVYDAATGFISKENLGDGRFDHTATKLNDGRVMVCGGKNGGQIPVSNGADGFGVLDSCEIYDPAAVVGSDWSFTVPMKTTRQAHAAVTLKNSMIATLNGTVIQCAGCDDTGAFLDSCETWSPMDPLNWGSLPDLPEPRAHHTLTELHDGRLLVTGGDVSGTPLNTGWVLDPAAALPMWMPTVNSMNSERTGHTATLLANDPSHRVLIVGGMDAAGASVISAQLYYPATNTFGFTNSIQFPRAFQQATALPDAQPPFDRVLVSGGLDVGTNSFIAHSAVYQVLLPNGAICGGAGIGCLSGNCIDNYCCDNVCTGTCMSCSAFVKGGGTNGMCEPVLDGMDIQNECSDEGSGSCGLNGFCDGTGACGLYDSTTVCGGDICAGDDYVPVELCDGMNMCVPQTTDCGAYTCFENEVAGCTTSCTPEFGCAAGAYCATDQKCYPEKANGASALNAFECESTFLADGVCCDAACDAGVCDACTAALGSSGDGACEPVIGNCDDGNQCTADSCEPGGCSSVSVLDGSLCDDGICYGGTCIPDAAASAGVTTGGATVSSSSGGESSGAGGDQLVFNFDDGVPELEGGGPCTASGVGRHSSDGWWLVGLALGLGMAGRRRYGASKER